MPVEIDIYTIRLYKDSEIQKEFELFLENKHIYFSKRKYGG